jgi:hypothetical protein
MTPAKKLLLVVVSTAFVVLAIGIIVRFLRRPITTEDEVAGFVGIQQLRPDSLRMFCGTPTREDIVQELGNSILDIHYHDSSGRDILFRFISTRSEPHDWHDFNGLGAWEQADIPANFGEQVSNLDAVRRMPCLARIFLRDSAGSSGFLGTPGKPNVPSEALASFSVKSVLFAWNLQQVDPTRPEPPKPQPPIGPGGNGGLSGGTTFGGGPHDYGLRDWHLGGIDPGIGGSDGGGSLPKVQPVFIPCPSTMGSTIKSTCELIEAAQFVRDMNGAYGSATSLFGTEPNDPWGRFERLVNKLSGYDPIIIEMPESLADRAKVMDEIFRLEVQIINLVSIELKFGVDRLSPFSQDSEPEKRRKLQVVKDDERSRRDLWKKATENAPPAKSLREISTGSSEGHRSTVRFNDSSAFRQLIRVAKSGNWGSN